MGKASNNNKKQFLTEAELSKAVGEMFQEWKDKRDYKKPTMAMDLNELNHRLSQLKVEKNNFKGLFNEIGHNAVEHDFYDFAIMEINKNIESYSKEIDLINKIIAMVNDKKFDKVRVLCSKELNEFLDKKGNGTSDISYKYLLRKVINSALNKLGYTDDDIDKLYGISKDNAMDSTVETSNSVKWDVDNDYGKCSGISQEVKDDECSNDLRGADSDDLEEEDFDVEYDIDDPVSYMKDSDSGEYYNVPLTGDIVDWGGINTSVGAVQQKDTSKKNFEAYLVIDGVDYSSYVDSVTAEYMKRELMIEIVDGDNNAIPKLVNYWEELYSCDGETEEEDIIVRTNGANKSFETFKDCAIIDFKCSSYVNEDFPRRANLVFSFGKATTEYCAE